MNTEIIFSSPVFEQGEIFCVHCRLEMENRDVLLFELCRPARDGARAGDRPGLESVLPHPLQPGCLGEAAATAERLQFQ